MVQVRKAVRALVNQYVIGPDTFDGKEQVNPSEMADALEVLITFVNYVLHSSPTDCASFFFCTEEYVVTVCSQSKVTMLRPHPSPKIKTK